MSYYTFKPDDFAEEEFYSIIDYYKEVFAKLPLVSF
jgi:hypothetical protein